MALTKEEKAEMIAAITKKIEGNDNLIIMVSSIDDAQTESDNVLSIAGKWSRNSMVGVFQECLQDLINNF
jgi:tRNA A37 threonylcarbamoyladenosine synthetase subunit TsaC/SUA5/YrdC